MSALKPLIAPRSIAILGASSDFRKLNGRPLRFLLEKGYRGQIYPVNPKYERIGELRGYPSVAAFPDPAALATVAVPAAAVEAAVRELGARGVRAAVVFSSGFAEMGDEGRALEARVIAAARAASLCPEKM